MMTSIIDVLSGIADRFKQMEWLYQLLLCIDPARLILLTEYFQTPLASSGADIRERL